MMRKRNLLLSAFGGAVGVGAGLLYLLKREGGRAIDQGNGNNADERDLTASPQTTEPHVDNVAGSRRQEAHDVIIDDQGTDQSEASSILKHLRDVAFESNDEKLALALGRPTEEIEAWTSGHGIIDGDVIMKARGLAIGRGVEID